MSAPPRGKECTPQLSYIAARAMMKIVQMLFALFARTDAARDDRFFPFAMRAFSLSRIQEIDIELSRFLSLLSYLHLLGAVLCWVVEKFNCATATLDPPIAAD
jgi:hypothetical protein